jgi:uncharacterized protein YeaO (DUF488 family)
MPVQLKRIYDAASRSDGYRVLVDRLWPRGLSKVAAGVDLWLKDVAPSDALRKWYHAHPVQWPAFRQKYLQELGEGEALQALNQLHEVVAKRKAVTLLYASKNLDRNNAVVLKELLDGMRKPPRSTGPAGAVAAKVPRRAQAGKR